PVEAARVERGVDLALLLRGSSGEGVVAPARKRRSCRPQGEGRREDECKMPQIPHISIVDASNAPPHCPHRAALLPETGKRAHRKRLRSEGITSCRAAPSPEVSKPWITAPGTPSALPV